MIQFSNVNSEIHNLPKEAISNFENRLKKLKIQLHGYMMIKGTDVLSEKYFESFHQDSLHRMYSVTKSFTSLAIGYLAKEGKISLDEKIHTYFSDQYDLSSLHPWCQELTIRDLLSMRTCFEKTTYKQEVNNDWTSTFFHVKPNHVPSTVFSYDTSASHVLAALVEKITGKEMLDYMRDQFLNEIGFGNDAYIIKDPVGTSQGGTGLMCTLRDLARVAFLCNQQGFINGKEIYPSAYLSEALINQVPTDVHATIDEQCGYGYMFWMPREEGFVMYGLGGQLAVCFPKKDFCLLTIADTIGNPAGLQIIYDSFYDLIYPHLKNSDKMISSPKIKMQDGKNENTTSLKNKLLIQEDTNQQVYNCYENDLTWKWIFFDWDSSSLTFETEDQEYNIHFHTNAENSAKYTFGNSGYQYKCESNWKQGHFILYLYIIDEEQGHVCFDFAWKDHRLTVRTRSTSEAFFKHFKGTASAKK